MEVCTDKVCDFWSSSGCTLGNCPCVSMSQALSSQGLLVFAQPENVCDFGSCVDREQSTTGHEMTLQPRTANNQAERLGVPYSG